MLVDTRKSPASFDLGAGTTIKASMGVLGMRQIDLAVDGQTTLLAPLTGAEPPLAIGGPLGTVLGFAALAAALERALNSKATAGWTKRTRCYVPVRNSRDTMDGCPPPAISQARPSVSAGRETLRSTQRS
jgi:hypothetical protein